jgi:hypothetical protein
MSLVYEAAAGPSNPAENGARENPPQERPAKTLENKGFLKEVFSAGKTKVISALTGVASFENVSHYIPCKLLTPWKLFTNSTMMRKQRSSFIHSKP